MTAAGLPLFVCWICTVSLAKGVILRMNGSYIPNHDRIVITDIKPTEALTCYSELLSCNNSLQSGEWYLNNHAVARDFGGWKVDKETVSDHQLVRLRKVSDSAMEGEFTCYIRGDIIPSASVEMYHPIRSLVASIVIVSEREGTFRVQCSSTGGRPLSMTVTGPHDNNYNLTASIQAVGDPQGMGDDEFTASTRVLSGAMNGDAYMYHCQASDGVSTHVTVVNEIAREIDRTTTSTVRVEMSQTLNNGSRYSLTTPASSNSDKDLNNHHTVSDHLFRESNSSIRLIRSTLSAPSGVVSSNRRTTSVRVSWQEVEDADRYIVTLSKTIGSHIQRGLCHAGSHIVLVATSGLSVVVGHTAEDMLRTFTTYDITVVAENVSGSSEPSYPVRFTTKPTNASVSPRNVRAIVVNSTAISVHWDALTRCKNVNGRIKWYRVQYTSVSSGVVQSKDERGRWDEAGDTLLSGLTPNTNYTIRVAAVEARGYVGVYSSPIIARTSELGAPRDIVVSDVEPTSVRVSWQPAENAERYNVTLSKIQGQGRCPSDLHTVSVVTSDLSVVVGQTAKDMLRPHTQYSIIVGAENNAIGITQYGFPISVTTNQTNALVSPRNVRVIVMSSTVLSVKWDGLTPCKDVNGRINKYRIQYTSEPSGVVQSKDKYGGWTVIGERYFLSGLSQNTRYTIRVAAVNDEGHVGLYSNAVEKWTSELGAPRDIVVSNVEPTSVRVSWQPAENAERYNFTLEKIQRQGRCPSDSFTASVVTSDLSIVVGQTVEDMLRPYTTYFITVKAENDTLGCAQYGFPVTFTTKQTNASVSPGNVRAITVNSTVISVQWDGLKDCRDVNGHIVKYRVQYTSESSGVVQSKDEAGEWNVTGAETSLTGLTPYTNYTIRVAAVNKKGHVGLYSSPITNQTAEYYPGPVDIVSSISCLLKVSISWTPPHTPNGVIIAYEVSYRPRDSSQTVTRLNTTDLATSFTTQSDLEVGTEFIFTVTAYTRVGSRSTSSLNVSTLSTPPVIQRVVVMLVDATAVNVSWDLGSSVVCIDYYTVVYSQVMPLDQRNQDGEISVTFLPNITFGVVGSLTPGHVYQFQVFSSVVAMNGTHLNGTRSTPVSVNVTYQLASETMSRQNSHYYYGPIIGVLIVLFIVVFVFSVYIIKQYHAGKSWWFSKGPLLSAFNIANHYKPDKYPQDPVYSEISELEATEPKIAMFPEDTEVIERRPTLFAVSVTGVPAPKMKWYHDGDDVMEDHSIEVTDDGYLMVPCAELRHSGVYQLVAVNKAGRAEREVTLTVKEEGQSVTREGDTLSPIPVKQFPDHVAKNHFNNNKGFGDQFNEIESCGCDHSMLVGFSRKFKWLNRYGNITVYDDNRIILRPIRGHSDCQREFINACYIDGYQLESKFVATQGPLHETTTDFWRLVWQERVHTIVMLANVLENSRVKCHMYWPDSGRICYGPFKVTITYEQILANYTTRSFLVELTGSSERDLIVTQYHFTAWPDHGVPEYATSLLALHKKVKKNHRPSRGPILVHCSAGVGRTGTFIAIDCVLDQLKKERVVDIAGTVIHLRSQRMKMVQSLEQYIFIHDAILEVITCGDTQIVADCLQKSMQELSHRDPDTHLTGYDTQFMVLQKVSPNPRNIARSKALANPGKNRSEDYLPGDQWRVVLKKESHNYIHAVLVNGYKHQNAFIVAQSPMECTVRDFWKMIYDRKCGVIIMLCGLVEKGQEVCYQYWPQTGLVRIGEYGISLLEEETMCGFIMRTFRIFYKKSENAHQVVQLHMTNWSHDGRCSSLASIVTVQEEMNKIQRRTRNKPIVVHCSDTVSRSGMFCAIANVIEWCKTEGVVDVFQVAKALRVQKPGAVCTVAQYRNVFETVLIFLTTFALYDNFQASRETTT